MDMVGPVPVSEEKYNASWYCVTIFHVLFSLDHYVIKQHHQRLAVSSTSIGVFGIPHRLVTDNGREFKNAINQQLSERLGIKRIFTSTYHPQSNGLAERVNSTIHNIISIFCKDPRTGKSQHNNWPAILPQVMYTLNTTVSPSSGFSPFQLMFGHCPRIPGFLEEDPLIEPDEHVRTLLASLQRVWQLARVQRMKYNDQMLKSKPKSPAPEFKPDSLV